MSSRARVMVFRDIVLADGGSDNIVDALCKSFSIGGAKSTGYKCVYTSAVTHGSLSASESPIKKRKVNGVYSYTSDITIVPGSGYGLPSSVTSVTATPAAAGYTYTGGRVRIRWSSAPAADASATVTATCPETLYTGAIPGKAICGRAIPGKV